MDKFLQTLANISPVVGTAIGGPLGGAVGLGIKAIAQAVTGKSDPDDVVSALQADPAKLADFELQVKAHELEVYKAQLADVQDARSQTVKLAQAGSPIAYGASIISVIVLATFGYVMYLSLTRTIPPGQENMVYAMLGTLSTMAVAVVSYWVGSSAGSAQKDHYFANLAQSQQQGPLPWLKGAKK